jgi:putative phosphoesterase
MLLGILSDTHDQVARTRRAVDLLRDHGASALVHCGDLTGRQILTVCAVLPCHFVFGNHDCDNVSLLRSAARDLGVVCLEWEGVVELAGKKVGVVHGHLRSDLRRVLECGPDYVLSGHSHIAADRREGLIRRINPGALHEADEYSVALLNLATDAVEFLRLTN